MRSGVSDVLPPAVRRSLTKFGSDLAIARRKRGLTVLSVAERMGVSKNTYLRAEKGDPGVGLGVYAMALFVLGFGDPLRSLIDVSRDDLGLFLDEERSQARAHEESAGTFRTGRSKKSDLTDGMILGADLCSEYRGQPVGSSFLQ